MKLNCVLCSSSLSAGGRLAAHDSAGFDQQQNCNYHQRLHLRLQLSWSVTAEMWVTREGEM